MTREKRGFNPNLILFLIGRMISDTGTSIQMMIMPLYILDIGGSSAAIGFFSFAALVPALLVYPLAGVLGDRLSRKMIMVVTDFLSAGAILGLALISYSGRMNFNWLLLGQMIISLLNGLFDPATRGMLPQIVAQNELTKANAKVASLRGISVLLGPVIGASLYARFGITVLFLINGLSFLLSGVSEMLIHYKHVKQKSVGGISGVEADLSEGIKFILKHPIIRRLCWFFLITYALIQPVFSIALPLFYKEYLSYSDTQYGYLQSLSILGMLLGSALVGLVFGKDKTMLKPLKVGCSLLNGSILMFAVLTFPNSVAVLGDDSILYFILLAAVFLLFSAAHMFINVPMQAFIQRETPNEYMSRVFSVVGMITRGGMPFGALVYGIVLEKVMIHWTVLAAALLIIVISILFLRALPSSQEH
ncbi:MAG: major facilitator superfamily 1 [Clostridia bacterium]|jgi:MFS family permease|nr:major facilitator superfamily 1 [Clostridia bacterium]